MVLQGWPALDCIQHRSKHPNILHRCPHWPSITQPGEHRLYQAVPYNNKYITSGLRRSVEVLDRSQKHGHGDKNRFFLS